MGILLKVTILATPFSVYTILYKVFSQSDEAGLIPLGNEESEGQGVQDSSAMTHSLAMAENTTTGAPASTPAGFLPLA